MSRTMEILLTAAAAILVLYFLTTGTANCYLESHMQGLAQPNPDVVHEAEGM